MTCNQSLGGWWVVGGGGGVSPFLTDIGLVNRVVNTFCLSYGLTVLVIQLKHKKF